MQVQYFRFWQSYPILNLIYANSSSGKLRYVVKKGARKMQEYHEDIMEWIRSDKLDHGWEGDAIPFKDKDFIARFEDYLLETRVEFEPHYFSEELMQFADGITGEQENAIAWLFEENRPEEKAPATEGEQEG